MSVRRFFTDSCPVDGTGVVSIRDDEYHHLKTVNRARPGDAVEVVNGKGWLYQGNIRSMNRNEAVVEVVSRIWEARPPVQVVLAPSLTKQRGMGFLIEKLAELGVDQIRPLIFSRTDESYSDSRLQKWHKMVQQSVKVNKSLWTPEVFPPVQWNQLDVETHQHAGGDLKPFAQGKGSKIVLDIDGAGFISEAMEPPFLVVVGPPGGMTDEERRGLTAMGFTPCKINDAVLKTETAAIAAAAIVKFRVQAGKN